MRLESEHEITLSYFNDDLRLWVVEQAINSANQIHQLGAVTMRKHSSNPNSGENTHPYPNFSTGKMRKEAEHLAHTDENAHARHEGDIAKLDRGEGAEKGGR